MPSMAKLKHCIFVGGEYKIYVSMTSIKGTLLCAKLYFYLNNPRVQDTNRERQYVTRNAMLPEASVPNICRCIQFRSIVSMYRSMLWPYKMLSSMFLLSDRSQLSFQARKLCVHLKNKTDHLLKQIPYIPSNAQKLLIVT
jgi:hypothetical protein